VKTKFKDITTIQTGLFAKPTGGGELVYLQAKHFDENGQIQAILYPDLPADDISEKHILKRGDVLFAAKGTKNFAAVFEDQNHPAVASTTFFVIRQIGNKLLPEYIAWFLNTHKTQNQLKGQAIGTAIPSISKQVLENLVISIPDIETQKTILKISKLRQEERLLKQKIETLRERQIQQQIINSIK
jgi:restriction endonuclease S subunit